MNKIRVIDLFNKIANGEEMPKKIKIRENVYCYEDNEYKRYIGRGWTYLLGDLQAQIIFLNDEVEIIEKEKKIEKVNTYVICDSDFNSKGEFSLKATEIIDKAFEEYSHKINEIIDYINKEQE